MSRCTATGNSGQLHGVCLLFQILLILFLPIFSLNAASIVSPGAQTIQSGNGNDGYPFNLASFAGFVPSGTQRYQQVYGASEFASVGGPMYITGIAFRTDEDPLNGEPFCQPNGCGPQASVMLAVTGRSVDGLSMTFTENLTSAATSVFHGVMKMSSSGTGLFDIVLGFDQPFYYNPGLGNLLLDVTVSSAALTTQFDFQKVTGDGVSRVFTLTGTSAAHIADYADSGGLVTQFQVVPVAVPEPATIWLAGGGLLAVALARRYSHPRAR